MKWYKKAAKLGNGFAMFHYAVGLEKGYSDFPNRIEAMEWYKKAADLDNVNAMLQYAFGLEIGYSNGIKRQLILVTLNH
jgi:TPR repeat protein